MITKEMAELNAACEAHDAAKLKLASAHFSIRELEREADAAAERRTQAHDRLERACRIECARAAEGRAALPTLPGADS